MIEITGSVIGVIGMGTVFGALFRAVGSDGFRLQTFAGIWLIGLAMTIMGDTPLPMRLMAFTAFNCVLAFCCGRMPRNQRRFEREDCE